MKTAPPNGKSAATPAAATPATGRAAPGGSVDKGSIDKGSIDKGSRDRSVDKTGKPTGKKPKQKMTPEQQKQMTVVGIAAAVVLVVGIGIYFYFNRDTTSDKEIRLNAPPEQMATFVATPKFDMLTFDRQRLYMKELANKKKELDADYKAGKLSKPQFENALAIVWLGKQFNHMDKYYSFGEIDKKGYLDELINKDLADVNDGTPPEKDAPERNKEKVKAVVEKMPDVDRRAYESFRRAIKEREKQRDREAKEIARTAKAASRPTTRPGDHTAPPAASPGAAAPAKPATVK